MLNSEASKFYRLFSVKYYRCIKNIGVFHFHFICIPPRDNETCSDRSISACSSDVNSISNSDKVENLMLLKRLFESEQAVYINEFDIKNFNYFRCLEVLIGQIIRLLQFIISSFKTIFISQTIVTFYQLLLLFCYFYFIIYNIDVYFTNIISMNMQTHSSFI